MGVRCLLRIIGREGGGLGGSEVGLLRIIGGGEAWCNG